MQFIVGDYKVSCYDCVSVCGASFHWQRCKVGYWSKIQNFNF